MTIFYVETATERKNGMEEWGEFPESQCDSLEQAEEIVEGIISISEDMGFFRYEEENPVIRFHLRIVEQEEDQKYPSFVDEFFIEVENG